jgi:hypothetical protein
MSASRPGPQPGPGWWLATDGQWYPPPPPGYPAQPGHSTWPTQPMQPNHPAQTHESAKANESKPGEKGERARAFREWVQTGQGFAALIVSIIALGGAGTGAGIAIAHAGSSSLSTSAPPVSITTPDTGTSLAPFNTVVPTQAQLTQALLPAQQLTPNATVVSRSTELSQATGICGAPLPSGAQLLASETLHDSQYNESLGETIIYWDTSTPAGTAISNDRSTAEVTGGCNYSSGGVTATFTDNYTGSPPQECGNGQYLATDVADETANSYGYEAEAQCGSFTIEIQVIGGIVAQMSLSQATANGYLNSAVGMLQKTLG